MEVLEEKIGYCFRDKSLLELALTHSSYGAVDEDGIRLNNERLEFLGDAFLDAVVGAELFKIFKSDPEGMLTKLRAEIVCEKSLAEIGRRLDLSSQLKVGAGEAKMNVHKRDSVIADAVEAILGAVYLDGGYEEMKNITLHLTSDLLRMAEEGSLLKDYKSRLQELFQKKKLDEELVYELVREEGPDHDKTFYIAVKVGDRVLGTGSAKTKKEAEKIAAMNALKMEE